MSESNKGLEFYSNLDLTHSHNDKDLQNVYKEWAPAYDHDNDNLLGTVSQPLSVQIFQEYIKDKSLRIIDVGCGTGLLNDFPLSKISLLPVAKFVTIANSFLFSFFFIISLKTSNFTI